MAIQAVFFDLDGTLVDSNEFHVVAWARAFSERGLVVARCAIREQIGKGADQLVPALFPFLDDRQRESVADVHDSVFRDHFLGLVQPFPRASELLARVADAGAKAFFASSSEQKQVDHYVTLLHARAFLAGTISRDDVSKSKPAGDIFAAALGKARVAAENSLVIGDTPYDAIAAARCGIKTILLRSGGFSDDMLQSSRPAAIFTDIAELLGCWRESSLSEISG